MAFLLRVKEPGRDDRAFPLHGERLTLGRSVHNELSYPEQKALSRQHAVFTREEGEWTVEDLGSRNGTYLNGDRLDDKRVLQGGDRLRLAELELIFEASNAVSTSTDVTFESSEMPSLDSSAQITDLRAILARSQSMATVVGGADTRPLTSATTALLKVGREMGAYRPLAELFDTILELATEAVGARRGLLMTLEDEELVVRARRGEDFRISKSVRDKVLNEKLSLLVADVAVDPAWEAHQSVVSAGIRSFMAAPLQTDDRVIGLLYLDSTGMARRFTADDLELITVMANVAAIRLERERLAEVEKAQQIFEMELRQAADIQRQCLPGDPPEVLGFDLAGFSRPCRTVGGDYYGFFPRADGQICVVLGDVAGKGMPASLLMMNLQARVQILAEDLDDPAEIARRLNQTLEPICPGNRFVTLFVSLLDPLTGVMAYCNAGHEPPLWVQAGGHVELLREGGPIVGLFPEMKYERGQIRLEAEDAVVLFSDGISEAFDPERTEFGTDSISAVFASRGGAGAKETLSRLDEMVAEWLAGRPAHDDATAVAVIRKPQKG